MVNAIANRIGGGTGSGEVDYQAPSSKGKWYKILLAIGLLFVGIYIVLSVGAMVGVSSTKGLPLAVTDLEPGVVYSVGTEIPRGHGYIVSYPAHGKWLQSLWVQSTGRPIELPKTFIIAEVKGELEVVPYIQPSESDTKNH